MRYKLSKQLSSFSYYHLFFIGFVMFILFFSANSIAHAITPTLSVSATGDGDSVQLNITGDPNTSVILYYSKSGYGQQISSIGNTNTNGTLLTTISTSQYGVVPNSLVYVTLGGVNGPQSAQVSWPIASSLISSSDVLALSQTGVVLPIGQSSTITATNLGSDSIYLSNNSNPIIANANLSGNQITVSANSYGSTVMTFCLTSNTSNCSSVYITVQNSNSTPLTFSQNSISMYSGQSLSIQISGGSGSYFVSNNSSQNQGVVGTSISGSTIILNTTSTTGASSITVCSIDNSSCGIINVTIGSSINSSSVSFSEPNPIVLIGQSLNVSIYGPSSSLLYVSSNSNPSIVQANLSGSTLTLLGISNGSSTINVCASANDCGSLNVTVNYNNNTNGNEYPILSQDTISLPIGQTANITVSSGSMPYNILSNPNNIFQPTLNINTLTIYGIEAGSSTLNVCSSTGNCVTLSITVTNGSSNTEPAGCLSTEGYSQTTGLPCNTNISTTTTLPLGCSSTIGYSQTNGEPCNTIVSSTNTLPIGCSSTEGYSQTTGLPCNTNISTTTTLPLGCSSTIGYSQTNGEPCNMTTITIPVGCASTDMFSTITGQSCPNYSPSSTPSSISTSSNNTTPEFTQPMKLGSTGTEVINLQNILRSLGFYKGKIDGGYGPATEEAVRAFQKAHGLTQLGSVGPGTRSALNQLS
jgi:hypothetical protein